jgi:hypothetical protein
MGNEKLRIPSSHLPVPEHQQELVERGVVEGILHWPNVLCFYFTSVLHFHFSELGKNY